MCKYMYNVAFFYFQVASFQWASAGPTIANLLNSIKGAKIDHWLQVT